jgi:hypothetical protein
MQPQPTSLFIHADAYRQELLACAEQARPKVPRKRTRRTSEVTAIVADGPTPRSGLVARCIAAGSAAFDGILRYRKESSSEAHSEVS